MTEYVKISDKVKLLNYLQDFEICFPHLKEKVDLREYAAKLAQNAENYILLLEEKPIGITCFYANNAINSCGYITLIGIMPNTQKGGFGKALINFTFSKMLEKGMKFAKLEVDKDNINAQGFYAHLGFEPERECENSIYLVKKI